MESSFIHFYRQFYRKSGGFIPCKPLHQHLYPGDFFQLRHGDIMVLGNIFHKGLIKPGDAVFEKDAQLYPPVWNISEGISRPYSSRGIGTGGLQGDFEFSKQLIAFATRGSFFFRGQQPQLSRIVNWGDLEKQLIIKLTQTIYSFRQVYVVTETATAENCTLAIAGAANAELEIASAEDNIGQVDLFGREGTKTIQSRDVEYYHREPGRKPVFFKAKRLKAANENINMFLSGLLAERREQDAWAAGFFNYQHAEDAPLAVAYQPSMLDLLPANQLNPNTALQYFRWEDTGPEDIENFFTAYGNG